MAGKDYCTISNVTYLVVYVDLRKSITNTTPFSCCTNQLLLLLMLLLLLLLLLIFHRDNGVELSRYRSETNIVRRLFTMSKFNAG